MYNGHALKPSLDAPFRPAQDALAVDTDSSWRRAVASAERVSLVAFRLLPHAALTVLVALQPAAFATRARYKPKLDRLN